MARTSSCRAVETNLLRRSADSCVDDLKARIARCTGQRVPHRSCPSSPGLAAPVLRAGCEGLFGGSTMPDDRCKDPAATNALPPGDEVDAGIGPFGRHRAYPATLSPASGERAG